MEKGRGEERGGRRNNARERKGMDWNMTPRARRGGGTRRRERGKEKQSKGRERNGKEHTGI